MQVEAIYNQGRLEFVHPIKLKHDHLRLVVVVPDDEILQPRSMREAINDILAPWQDKLQAGPVVTLEDMDRMRYEALEEKHLGHR